MEKKAKRVLAWLLSAFMLFSSVDPVYAAPDDGAVLDESANQHVAALVNPVGDLSATDESGLTSGSEDGAQQERQANGQICYVRGDFNGDGNLTNKDAIYLFYNQSFPDKFPIKQNADVNGDGSVTDADAFHLLSVYLWPQKHKNWVSDVHVYGEPVWNWGDNNQVTATFQCSCGKEEAKIVTVEPENVITDTTAATCTASGSKATTATVVFGGKTYTDVKVEVLEASGHDFGGKVASCKGDITCSVCGYVEKALQHNYQIDAEKTVKASCMAEGKETYVCSVCKASYTIKTADKLAHTLGGTPIRTDVVTGETCKVQDVYKCETCQEEVVSEVYEKHSYVAVITKAPTCKEQGTKEYQCKDCKAFQLDDDSKHKVETISVSSVHTWNSGEKNGNITTFTCSVCETTKTSVDASSAIEATISKTDLTNSEEIKLQNAEIKLPNEVKNQLGETDAVTISAATVSKDALNLSDEQLAQIPENATVYDFTLKSGDTTVSEFNKEVTITIPYTLGVEEDPDSIEVWYIDDNGKPSTCMGTYSNGFVTFTTNHFSYYTVTRLTPAERCEKYGHIDKKTTVEATCESEGYTLTTCQRCGRSDKTDVRSALGHNYKEETEAATCTTNGKITYTCQNPGCKESYYNEIPAISHNWELDEKKSEPATCTEKGKKVYVCGNDGTHTYEVEEGKLGHDYKETIVDATCEEIGYTLHKCSRCDNEFKDTKKAALGHEYKVRWDWDDKVFSATMTLTCTKNPDHVLTIDAAVNRKGKYADCENDGEITYTATATYNGKTYEDIKIQTQSATGHTSGVDYVADENEHAFQCVNCGVKLQPEAHKWTDDKGTIIEEQTCDKDGVVEYTCSVCKESYTKILEKTGLHTYNEYGTCTVCKNRITDCKHNSYHAEYHPIDGLENVSILVYTCDCGKMISDTELSGVFSENCQWSNSRATDGTLISTETTTYKDCDIVKTSILTIENSGADCKSVAKFHHTYTLNGKTVGDYEYSLATDSHSPSKVTSVKTIASSNGACHAKYYVVSCACGKNTDFIELENTHIWSWDWRNENDICALCFDRREWNEEENETGRSNTLKFMDKNGKTIDTLVCKMSWGDSHHFKTTYQMLGDNCEDGVLELNQCQDPSCGIRTIDMADSGSHIFDFTTAKVYDLNEFGYDAQIEYTTCLCGTHTFRNETCHFEFDTYDENLQTDVFRCTDSDCGLRYSIWREDNKTEEFEHGEYQVTEHISYLDKDNNALMNIIEVWDGFDHGGENIVEARMIGTTCDEGVVVKNVCKECQQEEYWIWDSYYTVVDERDLTKELGKPVVLRVHECICGNECYISEKSNGYSYWWDWYAHDEVEGVTIEYCEELDLYRECIYNYYGAKGLNCEQSCKVKYIYFNEDRSIKVSQILDVKFQNHRWEDSEVILNGKSCLDGFTCKTICKDCGAKDEWTAENPTYHTYSVKDKVSLDDLGIACGGYLQISGCACGETKGSINYEYVNCDFQWYSYDNRTRTTTYVCTKCGAIHTDKTISDSEPDENCDMKQTGIHTFMNSEKTKSTTFEYINQYKRHTYDFPVVDGTVENCEDGVTYTQKCIRCGYTSEGAVNGHSTFRVSEYDLSEYGFCGGTIWTYSCLCGKESGRGTNIRCNFEHVDYTSTEDGYQKHTYKCSECNGTYDDIFKTVKVEGCQRFVHNLYDYQGPTGKGFHLDLQEVWNNHIDVLNGEPHCNGDSCMDGWSVDVICARCGTKNHYTGSGHTTYYKEYYNLEEIGACNGGSYAVQTCPCGINTYYSENYSGFCRMQYLYTATNTDAIRELRYSGNKATASDALHGSVATGSDAARQNITKELFEGVTGDIRVSCCYKCGMYKFDCRDKEPIRTEGCNDIYQTKTILVGAKGTLSYQHEESIGAHHKIETSVVFLGDSRDCEQGVQITEYCTNENCNYKYVYSRYYHQKSFVEDAKVLKGSCGSGIEINHGVCPCEKIDEYSYYAPACSFDSIWDSNNGVEIRTCKNCGFVIRIKSRSEWNLENCSYQYTYEYEFLDKDKNKVAEYTNVSTSESHMYVMTHVEGETTKEACGNGELTVYLKCAVCDRTTTEKGYHHGTYYTDVYFLSDMGVGQDKNAYIGLRQCACGRYYNLDDRSGCNWQYKSEQSGPGYSIYVCSDSDCGATRKYVSTAGNKVGCERAYSVEDIYTYPNADSFTINYDYMQSEHNIVTHSELKQGSVTCTDGVIITDTCQDCSYRYSYEGYMHNLRVRKEYDLKEYGSTCGGKLIEKSCLCGEESSVSLDMNCDMSCKSVDLWISGVISYPDLDGGFQYTVNGNRYITNNAWIEKCAVTDPQCGFIYRDAEYYVPTDEQCKADRYKTYQLGYDEITGTYKDEVTVCVERNVTVHNYEKKQTTTEITDGKLVTTVYTCKDCGSTYTVEDTYETFSTGVPEEGEGYRRIKHVEDGVSTLQDGGYTHSFDERQYVYVSPNATWEYEKFARYGKEGGNVNSYWYQLEYERDWNTCTVTRTETSSYGYTDVDTYTEHIGTTTEWEVVSEATCSQMRREYNHTHCQVCNADIFRSEDYWARPFDHSFEWSDDKQVYVCNRCGLENVNGGSGSIIMEDMSVKHGHDNDYVIGYYKISDFATNYYVGVVLEDRDQHTSEDFEIVLTDIMFTELHRENDGIEAIKFSKADVAEKANEAVDQYKKDNNLADDTDIPYNIRFTFVPINMEDTLDYAITLTE